MTYKIPLFDLNYDENEIKAIHETLRSRWISMGPKVKMFESEFNRHLGSKHCIAVTNCTAALHLALKILGVGDGDEVIVPSLSFVATVNAVRYVNAIPVFADITSKEKLSIDPEDINQKVSNKTKAIIVMHYAGFACEMDKIEKIAKHHQLDIIEDAAHSPNSMFNSRMLGTIGSIGCFSFFSNKNVTCGEGGAIVTNDDAYAEKAKLLRSHGMTTLSYDRASGHATRYDVVDFGYNYRMDDIRAALLLEQLKKLEKDTKERNRLRRAYIARLEANSRIIIPYKECIDMSSNYIFPIVIRNSDANFRDEIRKKLTQKGIETSVHYPAIHQFSIYRENSDGLASTEYVADNEITLPLFSGLTLDQIEYITSSINRILK